MHSEGCIVLHLSNFFKAKHVTFCAHAESTDLIFYVFVRNIFLVRLSFYVDCKNINSIAEMLIGWCVVCTVGLTAMA
jgi:hypothetical protein